MGLRGRSDAIGGEVEKEKKWKGRWGVKSGRGKKQGAIRSFQATKDETFHRVTRVLTSSKQHSVTSLGLVFDDLILYTKRSSVILPALSVNTYLSA